MSYAFVRKVKAFTEITAETTANPPILLNNKVNIVSGWRQFVRLGGYNPKVYEFTKANDKTQTATITDSVTVSNPTADRDWNDSTGAYVTVAGNAAESTVRTYDFGTVATRYVVAVIGSDDGYGISRVYYSADGTTWTLIGARGGSAVTVVTKGTFRYIKWTSNVTYTVTRNIYLYSLEVFDPTDYTKLTSGSGNTYVEHEITTHDAPHSIILDADSPIAYYQYRISSVKVSIAEIEVIM